jgi:hypothetical protein
MRRPKMDQTLPTNDRRSRAVDRILNSRGALPQEPATTADVVDDVEQHRSFVDSGGKPQMAFSVVLESGEMHGFHYFNIDNLKYTPGSSSDYISFDHREKVVILRGRSLGVLFSALIGHTICRISEYLAPAPETNNVIEITITELSK